MTDKEQSAFDANFISIVAQIRDCMADRDAHKGVFSDVSVPEERIGILLNNAEAIVSWDVFSSHTLTIGSSDESEVL